MDDLRAMRADFESGLAATGRSVRAVTSNVELATRREDPERSGVAPGSEPSAYGRIERGPRAGPLSARNIASEH